MKKKVWVHLIISVSMLLAACNPGINGNKETESVSEDITSSEDVTVYDFIRMIDFSNAPHLKSWVSKFNGDHPNMKIKIDVVDNETDSWNATMAELVAGNGPDMFCMWAGDEKIQSLFEKGVLDNMDEYVPLEIKEQIFPGIIQSGSINQKWVGLGVEGIPQIFLTSDILWKNKTWTLKDVVAIETKHSNMEALFVSLDPGSEGKTDSDMNASYLFDNPYIFIDTYGQKSGFDNTVFIDALKLLRKYKTKNFTMENTASLLKDGKILGAFTRFYRPQQYVDIMKEYCYDGVHFVSRVGQKEGIGNWSSVYLILVNKNTKFKDELKVFLEGLLDYDRQRSSDMAMSVREDVIRGKVIWADWSQEWVYSGGVDDLGHASYMSFTNPDGESYLEEFVEFLKQLAPCKEGKDTISSIVIGEAIEYSTNSKSAEDTAASIDNRIMLFLRENQ